MNISKRLLLVGASMVLVVGLAACDKKEGSAEKAGESIDRATDRAGDKMDEASRNLSEQGEKAGDAIDDAAITTKVKAAILAEPGLKVLQIDVDTKHGVTTLSGAVDSHASIDKAKEVTAAVTGVKSVENNLTVK